MGRSDWLTYAAWVVLGLVAGSVLPAQAGVNAQLARRLGHPAQAAFASFLVGTLALFSLCLVLRLAWPAPADVGSIPLPTWAGGLLGAFFVGTTILLAPRVGATTMTGLVIAGQVIASLVLDHFALLGFAEHPAGPARLCGAALLVVGAMLVLRY